MSLGRKVLIVALILIGVILLFWALQQTISDPEEASAAEVAPEIALADPVFVQVGDPMPLSTSASYEKAGCANSTVKGKIETAVVGWDVMTAQLWQSFCWKEGSITSVGDLKKQMDVTTWGQAHGWREDGWRDGPNGWTNYGDKYHGGHYTVKTAKFKACLQGPLPGCIDSSSATIRLSLLQHAGGKWWGSVGK